jgi:hypothetical protein
LIDVAELDLIAEPVGCPTRLAHVATVITGGLGGFEVVLEATTAGAEDVGVDARAGLLPPLKAMNKLPPAASTMAAATIAGTITRTPTLRRRGPAGGR